MSRVARGNRTPGSTAMRKIGSAEEAADLMAQTTEPVDPVRRGSRDLGVITR
jgi:hypothetical protein